MRLKCLPCKRKLIFKGVKNSDNILGIIKKGSVISGAPLLLLLSKDKHKDIVTPRQMIMAILLLKGFKSVDIGRCFNRTHATVLHARKVVYNLSFTNPEFKRSYNYLHEKLNGV